MMASGVDGWADRTAHTTVIAANSVPVTARTGAVYRR
ncbi:hypothetical protein ATKI12_8844 [Kitasatospora sp. Ki12]